jgi:sugar lactone lactonase YvrE
MPTPLAVDREVLGMRNVSPKQTLVLILASGVVSALAACSSKPAKQIVLPGDRAYPESIAASADGTLYVSSLASGGVYRIKPGTDTAEQWIAPGTYGTRSTFGVRVDDAKGELWVCSNDVSALGVPGPGSAQGSNLVAFDLASGAGKVSVPLPGTGNICNDTTMGPDGAVYATNSSKPQILRLKPGASRLEVFIESPAFDQPKDAPGLDGIAFGGDGNLYVNTFAPGGFFRVDVKDGSAGKVTKLTTSRALKFPDGLRPTGGQTFVMAEGGGSLDRVTVNGDAVDIHTVSDGFSGPTGVALVGDTLWGSEGQLPHLFDVKTGPPNLPFRVVGVPAAK